MGDRREAPELVFIRSLARLATIVYSRVGTYEYVANTPRVNIGIAFDEVDIWTSVDLVDGAFVEYAGEAFHAAEVEGEVEWVGGCGIVVGASDCSIDVGSPTWDFFEFALRDVLVDDDDVRRGSVIVRSVRGGHCGLRVDRIRG